mmetsp:Transcript_13140/g.30714  ORF Transcript_13140/g.30714 Transcript_13140/m.30714 type:complete len:256 (+) Transcript_13140:81-848(+)
MPEIRRDSVTYTRKDSEKVGVLHFDDGKTNAFGHKLLKDGAELLAEAKSDLVQCQGALVVRGNARVLSSGFDLQVMGSGPEEAKMLVNEGGAFIESLVLFPRPVVVAATGHAVALGGFLLLTGDYRVGAATVGGKPLKVGLNETANNMKMPDFFAEGARALLAPQYLREAVALGLIFNAMRAAVVGFVDEIVDQEKVVEVAITKAEELASWCKHPAFWHNKKLVHGPLVQRIREGRQTGELALRWLEPVAASSKL